MNGWRLAARIALREARGGLSGLRLLAACLVLGVAMIAGVGSLSDSVVAGLRADARLLLGGDADLRLLHRPMGADESAWLEAHSARVSHTVEMRAMARPAARADVRTLVELKAVDGAYPLVGAVGLDSGTLETALARDGGVWGAAVDPQVLERLGLDIGDRLRVGDAEFVLRARVVHEPDHVTSLFNLGPRVMIAAAALPETGLVMPGSQIHYHARVALSPGTRFEAWKESLDAAFPAAGWRLRATDDAAPGVQRFVQRMTLFLTFVGLATLLVGGIGVANAARAYLDEKTATIATLKCLGAPGGLVLRTYLLLVMAVAVAGTLAGLAIGAAAPLVMLALPADLLPVAPRYGIHALALGKAAAMGLLAAATFALWPLARACAVPPARLFRGPGAPVAANPGWAAILGVAAGAAALAAMTVATSGDARAAAWFIAGAVVTVAALRLAAAGMIVLLGRTRRARGAVWRLAAASLGRPGQAAAGAVVSLGVGLSVLVGVISMQGNLDRQIGERLAVEAPALFFLDIQPDQTAAFDAAVTAVPGTAELQRVPSVRGRIVAIAGVPVEQVNVSPDSTWAIRGDRALTYAAKPTAESEVVAGSWWPADYAGPPLISLDAGLARGFGVGLGDTLTLNVLGRDITGAIASLREIDWRSLRFDFAIILSPGVLEGAPHTHIAAVKATPAAEGAVEKAVADRFANVSIVRVREALKAAERIVAGIGLVARATAVATIGVGVLVLAGVVAGERRRRIREAVVFKVLGATRGRILQAFVLEYGLLGALIGVVAAVVGSVASWALLTFRLEAPWTFMAGPVLGTVAACVATVVVVGFAGTWRALGEKAAPRLRND